MRIGLVEVGHWHARMYISALKAYAVNVIAVSDRNMETARNVASSIGCRYYKDYGRLMEREDLDFAFSFGRHYEMPAIVGSLIDHDISFTTEKPVGIKWQQAAELAERVEEKKVFAGVAFPYRLTPWVQRVVRLKREGKLGQLVHLHFRYIAGPPSRYIKWGCEWMLDKRQAGGGCTINLGVHFIDLFTYLTGKGITRVFAKTTNSVHGESVEDVSTVLLEGEDGALGIVETGYAHPSATADWHHFIITSDKYFAVDKEHMIERDGEEERLLPSPEGDNPYGMFVKDTLERFGAGLKPAAGLMDAFKALRIVNLAYQSNFGRKPIEL